MVTRIIKEARELPDGKWELGSDFQQAMIKLVRIMVTPLESNAKYGAYNMWEAAVGDWVFNHTALVPTELGPYSVRSVARMTLKPDLYTSLDNSGAMGARSKNGAPASWKTMLEHI
jgi:hypothetical protein